jgi:hypothetical protein
VNKVNLFKNKVVSVEKVPTSNDHRPVKSAHLKINQSSADAVRANQELVKQGTTLSSLQAKINTCKITCPPHQCRHISQDDKLTPKRRMELYRDYEEEYIRCSSYREKMEKAFDQGISLDDEFQRASYEGHQWQKLQLDLMAKECQSLFTASLESEQKIIKNTFQKKPQSKVLFLTNFPKKTKTQNVILEKK